jgi:transcriptional regulator with XRE-family HTH domain
MQAKTLSPAGLAREASTTEATISNWLNNNVRVDHVKAIQLFKIADAAGVDARYLLLDDARQEANPADAGPSHPLLQDHLTMAIQLVSEALAKPGLTLPPAKQAEAIHLAYDLLEEGMPGAKVLRFVRAAVA